MKRKKGIRGVEVGRRGREEEEKKREGGGEKVREGRRRLKSK